MFLDPLLPAPRGPSVPAPPPRRRPRREPPFASAELWRRALLIASLRDERTDAFAAPDVQLLWEVGLWDPLPRTTLAPTTLAPMTERDHADRRFGQARP